MKTLHMQQKRDRAARRFSISDRGRIAIASVAVLTLAPLTTRAVVVDFVPVGNPGNAPDPTTNRGAVADAFAVGKYEVTLNQYTEFLNTKAASDPFDLWNSNMQIDANVAGIRRSGTSGSFSYSVLGEGQRPVTYVSFFDAVRFTNWLHNGQGSGDTESGAYDLLGGTPIPSNSRVGRNSGARFWVPSENEWYKAAYHQPASQGGDADDYWLYPMQTNSEPFSDQPPGATPDNTRVGNFNKYDGVDNGYDDGFAVSGSVDSPTGNTLTSVGAYTQSDSFYGTFDQGGNVYEWNDTRVNSNVRRLQGGSWTDDIGQIASTNTAQNISEGARAGFRVATAVPEPTAAGLFALGTLLLLSRHKRS